MADKSLGERVIELESRVGRLEDLVEVVLLPAVVLVPKHSLAAPAPRKPRKRKIKVKPGFKRPRSTPTEDNLPKGVTLA